MKIVYTENPLCTRVELDAHESKNFWNRIKMAEMEELLFDAHFHMQEDSYQDMEKARRCVDPDYYMGEDDGQPTKLDQRVQMLHAHYVAELLLSHGGDCTCFPASCTKCQAERMLGIDTTPGLGKHMGSYVFGMFQKPEVATCAQAIAFLQSAEKLSDTGKRTLAWLVDYQETKLAPSQTAANNATSTQITKA